MTPTIVGEQIVVKTGSLAPNGYNPNRMDQFMYEKELASVKKFGFVNPIIARWTGDDQFEIIDGEHRWKVAKDLGMSEVPIWNLGRLSDPIAKQLTIVLNETRGSADQQKLGELLRDLLTSETSESLMEALPFTKERFDEIAGLPAWDWSQMEQPRQPQNPTQWVERIYRLSAEAARILDEAIAKVKDGDEMTDSQAIEMLAADFLAS